MSRITLKHSLATVIVAAGVVTAAGTASASVYQHDQTDLEFVAVTDGTSNTIAFGVITARPAEPRRNGTV